MGKPAARISDMHACPVTTPAPHVGGPIAEPGATTVLISGLPAATAGDACICTGAIDTIVTGATSVLIEGQPAARVGDRCAHGGTITTGCATVLIGEDMPDKCTTDEVAEPVSYEKNDRKAAKKRFRKPTPARRAKLINQAILDATQLLAIKLKGLKEKDPATMELFRKWFGMVDEKAMGIIRIRIQKELKLIKRLHETHFADIQDRETRAEAYAMVYPDDKDHTIYLGNLFWEAPSLGPDSRAGTLIHEASHFLDIGETRDFEYGDNRCLRLAQLRPDKALYNADNFERFIES